jgi:hypothetical protein
VERVIIYNEKQSEDDDDAEVIVKIFVEFSQMSGKIIILRSDMLWWCFSASCNTVSSFSYSHGCNHQKLNPPESFLM